MQLRADDLTLLTRLEDEVVLERLWRRHLQLRHQDRVIAPPHPRAAGMIAVAARQEQGARARASAVEGDLGPLATFLESADLRGLAPELVHHLAIYFGRLARAARGMSGAWAYELAVAAERRSIAAWLVLGAERRWLAKLADEILEPTGDASAGPESGAGIAERFALERIDEIGQAAERAAPSLAPAGQAALAVLAAVRDDVAGLEASERFVRRAITRAESRRAQAIDHALEPIREAVQEATTRDLLPTRRVEALVRATVVWSWSGRDPHVEHFVVEQLVPIAWELYRASQWPELRAALAPFAPVVEALASRIERDPMNDLAYAAGCADVLMFEAESQTTLDRQIAIAERLLRVCPSHRNGRLVLAAYLCDKATRMLDTPFVGQDVATQAEALVDRAEKLYPQSKALEGAKSALARARGRSPHAFWRRS